MTSVSTGEPRPEEITEDYRHRHIDIDIDKKERKKERERRIYTNHAREMTFKKLEAILKREGSNFSEWVFRQAEPYVRLHEPGNPQQDLERVIRTGEPYVAPKKCEFDAKPAFGVLVHVHSKKQVAMCKLHYSSALESGKWRVVGGS